MTVRAEEFAQRTAVQIDHVVLGAYGSEARGLKRVDQPVDRCVPCAAGTGALTGAPLPPRFLGLAVGIGRRGDPLQQDAREQIRSGRRGTSHDSESQFGPSRPPRRDLLPDDIAIALEDPEVETDGVRMDPEGLGEFGGRRRRLCPQCTENLGTTVTSPGMRPLLRFHGDSLYKNPLEQFEGAALAEEAVIDVRTVPKPERHPRIIEAYQSLEVGDGLILVNDHVPEGLRVEMVREFADAVGWEPLESTADEVRVRISKQASTSAPRVVLDVADLTADVETSGSVWQLPPQQRDLDANVIALTPGGEIREHTGPDLDVLIHVLAGAGTLETETGTIDLVPGQIVWLPRRSRRRFTADAEAGLRYFSVHQRKQGLTITARP